MKVKLLGRLSSIGHLNGDDTQDHMFQCLILKLKCPELYNAYEEKYEDIFSVNITKLIKIAKLCEILIRKREVLLS